MAKLSPVIIVDSREQRPWRFENLPTATGSLSTGDYSVRGLEHLIAVERKSLDDLLSCIGIHRDRFRRELARLRGFRFRCLIIEASHADLEAGQWRSQLKPSHVIGSLSAWMAQFDLPIW
ncbi:MAG: ERCC4 domain-containing protein, partial [Planctomycetes bacterium]|nr:ERCC4 domain-containing protein [Planctomycetota bacterium]